MWQYGITEETDLCQYWSYYILYPLLLCSLESLILFMGWNSSWLYFITRLHLQCKCSLKWEILCTVSGNVININNILHWKLSSQQRCCFHSGTLWRKWIASLPPKIIYSLFIILLYSGSQFTQWKVQKLPKDCGSTSCVSSSRNGMHPTHHHHHHHLTTRSRLLTDNECKHSVAVSIIHSHYYHDYQPLEQKW